jgi:hypothetical protein
MKKTSIFAFLFAFSFLSFGIVPLEKAAPLPFCTALSKVMKEEPTEFVNLKGKLVSGEGENQTYDLGFEFEGWPNNEWVRSDGAISVDITSALMTEEAAAALFETTSKKIASCLDMEGNTVPAKSIDKLTFFTKEKNDVGLMLINKKGKYLVMISISRES